MPRGQKIKPRRVWKKEKEKEKIKPAAKVRTKEAKEKVISVVIRAKAETRKVREETQRPRDASLVEDLIGRRIAQIKRTSQQSKSEQFKANSYKTPQKSKVEVEDEEKATEVEA